MHHRTIVEGHTDLNLLKHVDMWCEMSNRLFARQWSMVTSLQSISMTQRVNLEQKDVFFTVDQLNIQISDVFARDPQTELF
jgi:hypothetical protein